MTRRISFALLILLLLLALAACSRAPGTTTDPGVDLGDPDVGGGAGVDTGPQTPVPTGTATREASPRLPGAEAQPTTDDGPQTTATPTAAATVDRPSPAATAATPDDEGQATATTEPATAATTAATPSIAITTTPPPAGEQIHVVQAGENLYRIGLLYGLSWVAIADYNGITDPNAITVGQELRIPPSPTATATATVSPVGLSGEQVSGGAGEQGEERVVVDDASSPLLPCPPAPLPSTRPLCPPSHTVAAGDTLYTISQRYGVSWDQIAEANGLATPNQIYAGQVLKIPADAPGPTPEFGHQVHRGDTLSGLAQQYGLSAGALAQANDLAAPFVLFPGQVLVIPSDE